VPVSESVPTTAPTEKPTGEKASKKPKTAVPDNSSVSQRDARAIARANAQANARANDQANARANAQASRKKVTFDLLSVPKLRTRSKSPTPTVSPKVTEKQKPSPKPVGVPNPTLKPVGVSAPTTKPVGAPIPTIRAVGASKPIVRTVGTPQTTAHVNKPNSIIRTVGISKPTTQSTPLKTVLPSAKVKGILRHGVGFLATSCGVPLPRGFTFVTPTAFSVTAPYEPPDLGKYNMDYLGKTDLVNGLLRHFGAEDKLEGPIAVIGDPTKIPLPKTVKQAMATPFAKEWAEATVEEWLSLVGNNTWTLVEKKPLMKVIPCKWVYTVKTDGKGKFDRFKARLVAGGHRQIEGLDYNETYAHVTKHATVRTLLSVAANRSWDVQQLDIKTAFLHGTVDTDVYMMQPPGFVDGIQNVVRVDKSIYGLKQAPRIWYELLNKTLEGLGFVPMSADSSFWVKDDGYNTVYLTSVVDDMLITSDDPALTKSIVKQILDAFPGTSGGRAHYYNGLKITWLDNEHAVILSQPKHIRSLIDKFCLIADLVTERMVPVECGLRLCKAGIVGQDESSLLDTAIYKYRELIGGLSYIACGSRPDICFIVNQLARYANAPRVAHWDVAIHVLQYLKHTINWGICLGQGSSFGNITIHCEPEKDPKVKIAGQKRKAPEPDVIAYADANHGTSLDDKRSISGVILQVFGGPVIWSSKVQAVTALSTCESEFRAMSTAAREALWLTKIVDLFKVKHVPFCIRGDNKGAIASVTNYMYTKNTKHIEIHLDFMRDYYRKGIIDFVHIDGKTNPADMLTKAVSKTQFETFRQVIGMRPALD
jgi:hypothetical protein